MERRLFLTGSMVTLWGCSSEYKDYKEDDNDDQARLWQARADQLEAYGQVLTEADPGRFPDKIAVHVPIIQIADGQVKVTLNHPMAAEHWITTVYVRDQSQRVVWLQEFTPKDQKAEITFPRPAATQIVAYGFCNLHDHWKSEPLAI